MIDPTDLPTLKARLRDLLERAHPRPWLYRGKSDSIHVAPSEPPYQYGPGFLQLNGYDDDECKEADVDLIVEGINALPALLDELDRAESESALCKRFAEQNVEELNADELREYAIGLGERVARNEREMAAANGRLRARHAEEVARLRDVHLDETRALDDLRLKEIASLRDQLRKVEGERDVSRRQCGELHEHLALIVRYFEEETSEGDGIAEQHWAGYQLAKSVLVRTAPNEAAWETAMVEFAQLQERASHVPGLSAALDEARHERDSLRSLLPDVRACAEYCRNILIGPPGMPVEDYPLPPVALAARRILAALDSHECPECHMVERCKMSCSRGGSKGARVSVSPREGGE